MPAAGELYKDPFVLKCALIHSLSGEIIKLIEARDQKMVDPMQKDNKGDPIVLRGLMGNAEKQNIVDAINYRISLLQAKAAELTNIDLSGFNNIGNVLP